MRHFRSLLVHADPRAERQIAVQRALDLAKANGGRIKLMYVFPERTEDESIARDGLEALAQRAREGGIDVTVATSRGKRSIELIREVLHGGHELVFKDAEEDGDPCDMRLLRKCPCPVWLARPSTDEPAVRRVLAAVDSHADDDERVALDRDVLNLAAAVAEFEEAELMVLHAWSVFGENIVGVEEMRDYARTIEKNAWTNVSALVKSCDVKADVHLEKGDPWDVIPQFVEDRAVDLLVAGTIARTGISGLIMGNTAEKILRAVPCSVLAIKPAGFTTPVAV